MHFAELIPTPLGPSGETPIELYQACREINQQITPLHTGEGHAQTGTAKSTGVAEYFVERLAAEGISHCFGVAGDYVFPICDAVESSAKVKWVGCANELNAAYAADGYTRIRGAAMSR